MISISFMEVTTVGPQISIICIIILFCNSTKSSRWIRRPDWSWIVFQAYNFATNCSAQLDFGGSEIIPKQLSKLHANGGKRLMNRLKPVKYRNFPVFLRENPCALVSRLWLGTFPRNRGNSVEFPARSKWQIGPEDCLVALIVLLTFWIN